MAGIFHWKHFGLNVEKMWLSRLVKLWKITNFAVRLYPKGIIADAKCVLLGRAHVWLKLC